MVSGVSSTQSQLLQIMQQYGCTQTQAQEISDGESPSQALGQSTSGTGAQALSSSSAQSTDSQSAITSSEPQDPSTITHDQLQPPIDIKV